MTEFFPEDNEPQNWDHLVPDDMGVLPNSRLIEPQPLVDEHFDFLSDSRLLGISIENGFSLIRIGQAIERKLSNEEYQEPSTSRTIPYGLYELAKLRHDEVKEIAASIAHTESDRLRVHLVGHFASLGDIEMAKSFFDRVEDPLVKAKVESVVPLNRVVDEVGLLRGTLEDTISTHIQFYGKYFQLHPESLDEIHKVLGYIAKHVASTEAPPREVLDAIICTLAVRTSLDTGNDNAESAKPEELFSYYMDYVESQSEALRRSDWMTLAAFSVTRIFLNSASSKFVGYVGGRCEAELELEQDTVRTAIGVARHRAEISTEEFNPNYVIQALIFSMGDPEDVAVELWGNHLVYSANSISEQVRELGTASDFDVVWRTNVIRKLRGFYDEDSADPRSAKATRECDRLLRKLNIQRRLRM